MLNWRDLRFSALGSEAVHATEAWITTGGYSPIIGFHVHSIASYRVRKTFLIMSHMNLGMFLVHVC